MDTSEITAALNQIRLIDSTGGVKNIIMARDYNDTVNAIQKIRAALQIPQHFEKSGTSAPYTADYGAQANYQRSTVAYEEEMFQVNADMKRYLSVNISIELVSVFAVTVVHVGGHYRSRAVNFAVRVGYSKTQRGVGFAVNEYHPSTDFTELVNNSAHILDAVLVPDSPSGTAQTDGRLESIPAFNPNLSYVAGDRVFVQVWNSVQTFAISAFTNIESYVNWNTFKITCV